MSTKKILVAILIILVAVGGFVTGLYLLKQRQRLEQQAAVPGGQATVKIVPGTGNYEIGSTIQMGVYFNTASIAINGVVIRLRYPFSGSTPEINVSSININPALLSTGDWTCPTQTSGLQGSNVVIDVACANTSASGFASSEDVLLVSINLIVNSLPSVSPVVVSFDPAESKITRKSDNQDILLIPESTGSYTISGAGTQPTPTPTSSITATLTPTRILIPTPTSTASATPTPTRAQLPDAGISFPTIIGLGFGILVIIVGLFLAV